tara:strand:- start:2313 stop:3020 length:708 start_codon:yes stop_codon:yes gene_type:complete
MPQIELQIGALIVEGAPICNRILHLTITGITALDGSVLNGPIESYYTTCYDPLCSTVNRVRLMAGEFLSDVPDDTINQLIWYYSMEADLLNYCPTLSAIEPKTYLNYKTRWVTAAVILGLLSGTSLNGDMSKRLGDLSVGRSGAAQELLNSVRDDLGYLTSMLEDGGNYGRNMDTVTKASNHPDAPILSRQFARSDSYESARVPGANTRKRFGRKSDGKAQSRYRQTWANKRGGR